VSGIAESWSTQQLTEFVTLVGAFGNEAAAIRGAIERASEAFEAEVGAVVRDGELLASIGYDIDAVPVEQLLLAAAGEIPALEVPGVGACAVISAEIEDGAGRLLLARHGQESFTRHEANLLRGMAQVLTLTLYSLETLALERLLRTQSERQAEENAELLKSLRERQELLERLFKIQRSIVRRTKLETVLDTIVAGASELLRADAVSLRMLDPQDPDSTVLLAVRGLDPDRFFVGSRLPLEDGIAGRVVAAERLVVIHGDDAEARAVSPGRDVTASMSAPVVENGRVVGALTIGSRKGTHRYSDTEQEVLLAFAEHASLALTDSKNFDAAVHRALHDLLTGLPNRALFLDRLEQAVKRVAYPGERAAVLFLDLDGFKRVNDSMGHAAGDELLIEVARRLSEGIRPGDTAARFGGDEFAVLLDGVTHETEAAAVAERLMASLRTPFLVQSKEVLITASVGIALPSGREDDLLRDADLAMYHAKGTGKGRIEMFDPDMHTALIERLSLEADLTRGVANDEFALLYQPIVSLGTGAVVGVEALLRWRHPTRGLLAPETFLATAEETGLIHPIGRRTLRRACADAARWQAAFGSPSPLCLAVNLSVNQLQNPDLIGDVAGMLADSGLHPQTLILEITETLFMDDRGERALWRLKELGAKIAIDDFGTGYSSLQYLSQLPIDVLKIAKPFVDGLGSGRHRESPLAQAIIDVSQSLRLDVIAEGIERSEQAAHLLELGCRMGQGYFFARPQEAPAIDRLLAERGVTGWAPVALTEWAPGSAQDGPASNSVPVSGPSSGTRTAPRAAWAAG
jgi:diguanylate cyclase (GGDEF)-like protein